MSEVVPLADAHEDSRFGAKATGLGAAERTGLPIPPGIALSGAIVDAVAAGNERAIEQLVAAARSLAAPLAVRSSAVDEDGADASFAGQHLTLLNVPSVDDVSAAVREIWWSANSDSAITLPPARRPLHAPERRCRRAVAARSRRRRGDVHAEPDQPGRRAADRGELGSRRGGRRRPRDPRQLPHGPRRRGARTHTRGQEDRDPRRGRRRHRRGDRRAGARRAAVPRRRSARAAQRARRAVRAGVRTGARHRVGVRGRAALPAAVPRGDAGGIVTAAGRRPELRAGRSR